jgi:glycine cleavage system T protein
MVEFAGWEMPMQYPSKIVSEHLATRKFAGLFDVSHMGRFIFNGPGKIDFLQHVLSNNCLALEPWQAQYTMIPNEQGGALDDAFLYRLGQDDYLLVVNASNADQDWQHFQRLLPEFPNVAVRDVTNSLSLLALQGPRSKAILERMITSGLLPEPKQNYLSQASLADIDLIISRTGYTGEPNSFEIFVAADKAQALWDALMEVGTQFGLAPVGLGARDTLRLEAGMPLYGHELGSDPAGNEIPIFAIPLAPVAVSFSPLKGDFVGRPALFDQFEESRRQRKGLFNPDGPLARTIKPLALLERGVTRRGDRVFDGEDEIGVVTSGTSVPYWEFSGEGSNLKIGEEHSLRPIALAYLDAGVMSASEVEVQVRKRRLKGQVVQAHGRSDAPPYFHPLPVGWQRPETKSPRGKGQEKFQALLKKSLANHHYRQQACINLIPSEQTSSPLVRLLSVSDPMGRYAEHRQLEAAFGQEVFFYQGTDFIAWVEDRVIAEMAQYMGCTEVEARPISGQMANMAVFSAMVAWKNLGAPKLEPARLGLAVTHHIGKGGHLSAQAMGGLRDYIAKNPFSERFAVINFPVKPDNPFQVDLEETAVLLEEFDPELIVFGRSMALHKEPVAEVAEMVAPKRLRPVLMYDMAHTLGLLGPHFQSPLKEGADLITASTHKTFFGTQRGVIGCSFSEDDGPYYELWQAIKNRSFPGMLSNHHLGTLLGLLAAAIEMNAFKDQYQPQVIKNAKALAKALCDQGLSVCGDSAFGFTETHQVVVDVGYGKGPEAARRLEDNNIIVNFQALPWDEGFTASSGLRLGVSEMTRFGMKEEDFRELASLMADVILQQRQVRSEVIKLRQRFTELNYCFDEAAVMDLKQELLATF